jgi:adenylate cyclase
MEPGVLFADLRGFTAWCESQPPQAVAQALNQFYATE